MATTTFPLTIRRPDVLEMYREQFHFSWLDPFILRLVFGGLISAGAAAYTYLKMLNEMDFTILFFFSSVLFLGICTALVVAFVEKRKVKQGVNRWVDTFIDLKGHEMVVEDARILYRREKGISVYSFADMVDFHAESCFYSVKCRGELSLSIPFKSFAAGDADRFGDLVQANLSHYLAQTARLETVMDASEATKEGEGAQNE